MSAEPITYTCTRCSNPSFATEDLFFTGKWGRFFDMQSKKFTAVICDNCGYAEFYRQESGRAAKILDLLASG